MRALEGRRFLSDDAPRLPLTDCTAQTCACRYTHHDDRRSQDERRIGLRVIDSDALVVRARRERRAPGNRTG